jgi:hypothetical protein
MKLHFSFLRTNRLILCKQTLIVRHSAVGFSGKDKQACFALSVCLLSHLPFGPVAFRSLGLDQIQQPLEDGSAPFFWKLRSVLQLPRPTGVWTRI